MKPNNVDGYHAGIRGLLFFKNLSNLACYVVMPNLQSMLEVQLTRKSLLPS